MLSRRQALAGLGGAVAVGGVAATAFGGDGGDDPASALVAGSLLAVANGVEGATVEAHGSAAAAQLIHDGAREPDAVALADPRLFAGISEQATLFATNALVLAHHEGSDHTAAMESDWTDAIHDGDIRIGRTDPATDPLGYRTVMALRLATAYGVDAERVREASSIHPETEIMNLVERGDLDCAFTYRNMAVERDLPFVDLPARVDFSDPSLADHYATVSVEVGDRTLEGAPIRYAATALTDRGAAWTDRLVTGHERLRDHGFVVPDGYPSRGHEISG